MIIPNLQGSSLLRPHPAKGGFRKCAPEWTALTLLLLSGVLFLGAETNFGKDHTPTTRTITGVVTDDADNTLQGATIELTDVQTGKVLDIYSQADGKYLFADLRFDHDYTVKAMYKGSSSEVRRISILETRWTLVLNLTVPQPKK
jgi:hypothetical protein